MANYFITGIGTDVGKTLVAAIITESLQADYWKPVQSGTSQSEDKATVENLISNPITKFHKESYSFKEPLSPHYAAILENQIIKLDNILFPDSSNENMVIEGAGGVLVPLNDNTYVIEIAENFNCDVIVVVRNYLGCINHTLLTLEYLMNRGINVVGIVLNGNFDEPVKKAITNYSEIPVVLELPELNEITKEKIIEFAGKVVL